MTMNGLKWLIILTRISHRGRRGHESEFCRVLKNPSLTNVNGLNSGLELTQII